MKVTIYYRHYYLHRSNNVQFQGADLKKVELFIYADQIDNTRNITDYMHEVGVLFDLEVPKTIDWNMMKEVPDELEGTYDPNNPVEVAMLPGRTFWLAEGYR